MTRRRVRCTVSGCSEGPGLLTPGSPQPTRQVRRGSSWVRPGRCRWGAGSSQSERLTPGHPTGRPPDSPGTQTALQPAGNAESGEPGQRRGGSPAAGGGPPRLSLGPAPGGRRARAPERPGDGREPCAPPILAGAWHAGRGGARLRLGERRLENKQVRTRTRSGGRGRARVPGAGGEGPGARGSVGPREVGAEPDGRVLGRESRSGVQVLTSGRGLLQPPSKPHGEKTVFSTISLECLLTSLIVSFLQCGRVLKRPVSPPVKT